VDGLKQQYAGKIDFIIVDFDNADLQPVRDRFGITDRSQYVLIDAAGNVVQRWYGVLDTATMQKAFDDYLAKL
jgi:hypothetical protein